MERAAGVRTSARPGASVGRPAERPVHGPVDAPFDAPFEAPFEAPVEGRVGDTERVTSTRRWDLPWWSRRPPGASIGGTARADAERALAYVGAALRGGIMISVVVGAFHGLSLTTNLPAYLTLFVGQVAISTWLVVTVFRHGSLLVGGWRYADLLWIVVTMVAMRWLLPPDQLVGPWTNWTGGLATNAMAVAAVWLPTTQVALAVSLGLAGVALASVAGLPGISLWTVAGNGVIFPLFALSVAVFSAALRRTAQRADAAHDAAVEAVRALELDRYRILVHDATGIMRQLGDERTPAVLRPALMRQALAESVRLRNYLAEDDRHTGQSLGPTTLGRVLTDATAGFSDLPLELSIDLGAHVVLPEKSALALGRAVSTLLHNVRRHAHAETVFVHADQFEPGGPESESGGSRRVGDPGGAVHEGWEVVIRDDGVGFDPLTTPLGFGLSVQVMHALRERAIDCHLESRPGTGTTVTIRGALGRTTAGATEPVDSPGRS